MSKVRISSLVLDHKISGCEMKCSGSLDDKKIQGALLPVACGDPPQFQVAYTEFYV
jgi:hypothetical protein